METWRRERDSTTHGPDRHARALVVEREAAARRHVLVAERRRRLLRPQQRLATGVRIGARDPRLAPPLVRRREPAPSVRPTAGSLTHALLTAARAAAVGGGGPTQVFLLLALVVVVALAAAAAGPPRLCRSAAAPRKVVGGTGASRITHRMGPRGERPRGRLRPSSQAGRTKGSRGRVRMRRRTGAGPRRPVNHRLGRAAEGRLWLPPPPSLALRSRPPACASGHVGLAPILAAGGP